MPPLSSFNKAWVRKQAEADALRDLADGAPEPAGDVIVAYGNTLGKHGRLPRVAGEHYAAAYRETRRSAFFRGMSSNIMSEPGTDTNGLNH